MLFQCICSWLVITSLSLNFAVVEVLSPWLIKLLIWRNQFLPALCFAATCVQESQPGFLPAQPPQWNFLGLLASAHSFSQHHLPQLPMDQLEPVFPRQIKPGKVTWGSLGTLGYVIQTAFQPKQVKGHEQLVQIFALTVLIRRRMTNHWSRWPLSLAQLDLAEDV